MVILMVIIPKNIPCYFLDPRGSKFLVIYIMESQDLHSQL